MPSATLPDLERTRREDLRREAALRQRAALAGHHPLRQRLATAMTALAARLDADATRSAAAGRTALKAPRVPRPAGGSR